MLLLLITLNCFIMWSSPNWGTGGRRWSGHNNVTPQKIYGELFLFLPRGPLTFRRLRLQDSFTGRPVRMKTEKASSHSLAVFSLLNGRITIQWTIFGLFWWAGTHYLPRKVQLPFEEEEEEKVVDYLLKRQLIWKLLCRAKASSCWRR